ncbi:macrophage mannose receptor 1-like [Amphiura filiformis]|uniref:macrophage mannose receptor 1-like n=1 Tax=Amphiura filiformis TaxID=82378 RepID=UPI003B2105C4
MQYKYQCFQLFSDKLNWYEARLACQTRGGDLAALKTMDVHNFIAQYVQPTGLQHWIGLHDITDEGRFTWSVDEELLDDTQSMWDVAQPDNYGEVGEDCVEMNTDGMWNDLPCTDYEGPYVCERPNDVIIKCDESNGWISAASACYKYYGNDYTWTDANNYCQEVGASLISVESQEEQDLVSLQGSTYNTDIWIGATDLISGVPGGYTWPDGTDVGPYTNWAVGQPDNSYFSMGGDCVEVASTATNGQWNTAACTSNRKFVCEKPEGTCPDGWRIFRGNCYQLNTNIKYTWTDSKHYCETQGSFLVDIQSSIENNYITSLFDELDNVGITDFWIGISDLVQDGSFAWSDGSNIAYTNWNADQPSDTVNIPDCGTIFTGSTEGKWSTGNCYGLQAFVCKVPIGQAVKPVPPEVPLGDCPAGWSLNGESCYYLDQTKKTYYDARTSCEAMGSTLTSIHSADEQSYHSLRVNLVNDWVWIGFHDITDEAMFEWEDGTPVDFTNWAPGQPDNYGDAGEDCTHMRNGETEAGEWNDLPCDYTAYYMCKLPKACDEYISDDTEDEYNYRYHPAQKSVEYLYFEVKASNDVHIGLSPIAGDAEAMYEIVIGGFGNMQSVIRRCIQCENEVVASTPSILNINEWRGFWITYNMNTGKMEVGKEAQGPFMIYTDPNPIQVKYVGYSTGFGSEGKFRFCNLTDLPTQAPTPVFDARCGLGWEFDPTTENCYLFRETDYRNWDDAETMCRKDGGNLVSIISVEEQTYINARLKLSSESVVWIGANDLSVEGGWQWSSGDPFRYLNWNPGEPNNQEEEHCGQVYIASGKWNDNDCSQDTVGYICKKTGYITSHFTVSPNLYLPGNDALRYRGVYPDECARLCVEETSFNCLSFDYNKPVRECDLSDTTGALNGELYSDPVYDYYEKMPGVGPDPVPATLPPNYRCDEGWAGYGSYCYQVQNVLEYMVDARTRCRILGGDLVSIHDANENDFVLNLVASAGVTEYSVWIGLNDLALQNSFDWTDDSVVDFTSWNANEPNNFGDNGEDCVEMFSNGAWNDQVCDDLVPSVCKKMKEDLPPTEFPITPSGCSLGWVPYQYSCYYVESNDKATWSDAVNNKCTALGGNLVSIADRFEQSVLTSQLGLQDGQMFWIGLSDLPSPGQYSWSDGTPVTYTHWDQGMPDNSNGDCVAATSGTISGLWQDQECNNEFNYVCEKVRLGFTAPPVTVPPAPTDPSNEGCAAGWIGYGNNCFRVDEVENSETLFWVDAQQHCRNMGAELASFHSKAEEDYIKAQANVANTGAGFWIGLHDSSVEGGFEWTDGSPVDHTSWEEGEPNDYDSGEDCVEMFFSTRGWNDMACDYYRSWVCKIPKENGYESGKGCVEMFFSTRGWNDMACDYYRSWVCKIPKGVVPITTPAPSAYPSCPSDPDWVLRGDYCYYFSSISDDRRGWTDANGYCMDYGGYLVSIHSDDENAFIYDMTTRVYDDYIAYWLGIRTYSAGGKYSWSDGSPLDYIKWQEGEPNDFNGEEQCGEYYATDANWNDINCGEKIPFICKRANGNIQPITYAPTPLPTGNCPNGALKFDSRCYMFLGALVEDRTDWEGARARCEGFGMQLATIHSQQVQSYLTSNMKDLTYSMWIGLSDRTFNHQFVWADGTVVDFTNWNNGEPNDADEDEDCVEMIYREDDVGEWNDLACATINGFVCQRNPDPSLPDPGVPSNSCKKNYVQYYDSCFRVLTSQPSGMTFDDAQTACKADGTDLASIKDVYEQAFVETRLHVMGDNPLWVGLVDDKVAGEYSWVDGWPVYYTNWGTSEPSRGPGEGCVAVEFDGLGMTQTAAGNLCLSANIHFVIPTPTDPPQTPGTCEEDWIPYGSSCYQMNQDVKSWPEAEYQCERFGATVASVHSRQENEFIRKLVDGDWNDIWLGLHRDDDGGFMWHDGTPVDYANWALGEPTLDNNGQSEQCVELWSNGYWNDIECLYDQYYVCKKPKITEGLPTTLPTLPPAPGTPVNPGQQTGVASGGIVGIIIAILVIILLVGIIVFFVFTKGLPGKSKGPLDIGSVGFDNALYNASAGAVQVTEKATVGDPTTVA